MSGSASLVLQSPLHPIVDKLLGHPFVDGGILKVDSCFTSQVSFVEKQSGHLNCASAAHCSVILHFQ